jgi:FixJ family two-component response regulator
MTGADATQGTVFVVDDDPSVRKGLARLIRSAGLCAEAFASAEEFMHRMARGARGCLVLDVQMPGLTGLELQDALARLPHSMPIIFITGHGDIPMGVRAMKKGAVDFLSKPFDDHELLDAIVVAIRRDRQTQERRSLTESIRARINSLTPRELEVMTLVTAGYPNKHIGTELGISEKTVKVHRGRVMRKMAVNSLAELVRDCEKLARGAART